MPRIPLYVHTDRVAYPRVSRRVLMTRVVMGVSSAALLISAGAVTLLCPADDPLKGVSLPLFVASVGVAGAHSAYRTATDPARVSARHLRYLSKETPHDR